jgi:hypothetical protein
LLHGVLLSHIFGFVASSGGCGRSDHVLLLWLLLFWNLPRPAAEYFSTLAWIPVDASFDLFAMLLLVRCGRALLAFSS